MWKIAFVDWYWLLADNSILKHYRNAHNVYSIILEIAYLIFLQSRAALNKTTKIPMPIFCKNYFLHLLFDIFSVTTNRRHKLKLLRLVWHCQAYCRIKIKKASLSEDFLLLRFDKIIHPQIHSKCTSSVKLTLCQATWTNRLQVCLVPLLVQSSSNSRRW